MKKKLNLVLRDPVRLNQSEVIVSELPSPFEKKIETVETNWETKKTDKPENENKSATDKRFEPRQSVVRSVEQLSAREKMSPRIRLIWDYLCFAAGKNQQPQKSFSVTRAEVMREAGIGSTNTYRDALEKFQNLELLEIELRPGVISGSIFTFTAKGWQEAGFDDE